MDSPPHPVTAPYAESANNIPEMTRRPARTTMPQYDAVFGLELDSAGSELKVDERFAREGSEMDERGSDHAERRIERDVRNGVDLFAQPRASLHHENLKRAE